MELPYGIQSASRLHLEVDRKVNMDPPLPFVTSKTENRDIADDTDADSHVHQSQKRRCESVGEEYAHWLSVQKAITCSNMSELAAYMREYSRTMNGSSWK